MISVKQHHVIYTLSIIAAFLTLLLFVTVILTLVLFGKPANGAIQVSEDAAPMTKVAHVTRTTNDIIGMQVNDFQLKDHLGGTHQLYGDQLARAIVLMTQGNGCPIVRNALPGLRDVRDAYVNRGIKFFLLNSNIQDNKESIVAEAVAFGFDMSILIDENQRVGESLKVSRTAEIFVIDPATRRVVYHGPMDDRLTYQAQRAEASKHYLADALDAVLEGRKIEISEVNAPGCLINFSDR